MKSLLKALCGLGTLSSLVLLLYGVMKLYRAENTPPPQTIEIDIPGVKVVTRDENVRALAMQILAGGGVGLLVSVVGLIWVLRSGRAPQSRHQEKSSTRRSSPALSAGLGGGARESGTPALPDLAMLTPSAGTEPSVQSQQGPVDLPLNMIENPEKFRH